MALTGGLTVCRMSSGRAGTALSREGLWDRFDHRSWCSRQRRLETDILAVAQAFRDAADELLAVANQLADDRDVSGLIRTVGSNGDNRGRGGKEPAIASAVISPAARHVTSAGPSGEDTQADGC